MSSVVINSENSSFNNYCAHCKDCYMNVRLADSRDAYYSYLVLDSENCVDCSFIASCHHCYGVLDCENCYRSKHSHNCRNCQDVSYCKDCVGCKNCFLCVGLNNQEYCVQNKKYAPEEYTKKVYELLSRDPEKVLRDMLASIPHREHENMNCENVVGNHLKNSQDLYHAFDSQDLKKGKYLIG